MDFDGEAYRMSDEDVHTSKESVLAKLHHHNWRQKAVEQFNSEDSFNFTSVVSISKSDSIKIRSYLKNAVKKVDQIVVGSKEEQLVAINLDVVPV